MPGGKPKRDLVVDLLVGLGIVVSLGLIAVSAMLNYRIGYRAADTEIDGMIYGSGAALCDVLKAMCPFIVAWGVKKSDWLAVGAAAIGFIFFTLYSVTAGMGFASQHRAFRAAERTGAIEQRGDLRRELAGLEAAADQLGAQRSEATIGREVEGVFARPVAKHSTVASVSSRCTLVRTLTRDACAEIAGLMTELEKAREWADLQDKLAIVRAKLEKLGAAGASGSADPQIDTLQGVFKLGDYDVKTEDIRVGLVALVAIIFELGSGIGLYLVTTPWRSDWKRERVPERKMMAQASVTQEEARHVEHAMQIVDGRALGRVDEFALARLDAGEEDVSAPAMFELYRAWCEAERVVPLSEGVFFREFDLLAEDIGIEVRQHGGNVEYLGIRTLALR